MNKSELRTAYKAAACFYTRAEQLTDLWSKRVMSSVTWDVVLTNFYDAADAVDRDFADLEEIRLLATLHSPEMIKYGWQSPELSPEVAPSFHMLASHMAGTLQNCLWDLLPKEGSDSYLKAVKAAAERQSMPKDQPSQRRRLSFQDIPFDFDLFDDLSKTIGRIDSKPLLACLEVEYSRMMVAVEAMESEGSEQGYTTVAEESKPEAKRAAGRPKVDNEAIVRFAESHPGIELNRLRVLWNKEHPKRNLKADSFKRAYEIGLDQRKQSGNNSPE